MSIAAVVLFIAMLGWYLREVGYLWWERLRRRDPATAIDAADREANALLYAQDPEFAVEMGYEPEPAPMIDWGMGIRRTPVTVPQVGAGLLFIGPNKFEQQQAMLGAQFQITQYDKLTAQILDAQWQQQQQIPGGLFGQIMNGNKKSE